MAALTDITALSYERNGCLQNQAPVAASTTLAITDVFVGLNSGGFAGPLSTGTFTEWFGVLSSNGRNPLPVTGSATVTESTKIVADQGVKLQNVAVTGAASEGDNGATVYASDSGTLTLTQGSNVAVGFVARWITGTDCDVQLFTPAQQKA